MKTSPDATTSSSEGPRGKPWSMRHKLLVIVNVFICGALALFLAIDYQSETASGLEAKRRALDGEAHTLLPAVQTLIDQGADAMQLFVDDVCAEMQEGSSPGHHIVVERGDVALQARVHHRDIASFPDAMRAAAATPNHKGVVGGRGIVVGEARAGDTAVYVSEYIDDVKAAVRAELTGRAVRFAALGLLVTLAVNLVLVRIVTKPLSGLVDAVRHIGRGELGFEARGSNSAEFDFLASELNAMSRSLKHAQRERDWQFNKATRLQRHLCAADADDEALRIASWYLPTTEVAGDYYDVIAGRDGSRLIFVADVCGHGVPAAMGAAILKALLIDAADSHDALADILRAVNRRFHSVLLPEDFASAILLRWRPASRRLEYASAGHERGYLLDGKGGLRRLDSTGGLLGILPDARWEDQTFQLEGGERLILLTDGVADATDSAGRRLGRTTFEHTIARSQTFSLDELMAQIRSAVLDHVGATHQSDDMTVVAVELHPARCGDRDRAVWTSDRTRTHAPLADPAPNC